MGRVYHEDEGSCVLPKHDVYCQNYALSQSTYADIGTSNPTAEIIFFQ
jgi:hypothetical protein